jgi:hypothetical protein
MSGNVGAEELTRLPARQERAALLVALDQLTDVEIARQAGVTDRQLLRWKRQPLFAARVDELRAAFARAVEGRGIADRQARVQELQGLFDRMKQVVEGRAEDMPDVPGGPSGLLVRQYKQVGRDDFREEYPFDAALAREIRATLQQAAQELGQWTERRQVSLTVDELDAAIERELARMATGGEADAAGAVARAAGGGDGRLPPVPGDVLGGA